MANGFRLDTLLGMLENTGVLEVALPFLLVFVIVFAVLEKTKIMGEHKKNLNVVIALVLSLSVVFAHSSSFFPGMYDPVEIINKALPSVSLLVVAIMMLLILIGVFAHDKVMLGVTMPGWIAFFAFLAIIFIFGAAAGWWGGDLPSALEQFFGEEAIAIAVMILVFAIIIGFITSDGEKNAATRFGFKFDELFGKGGGGGGHH
jgi:hypothetical protein